MTTEREQVRKTRTASEERAAIFWAVGAVGTVIALEGAVIIFLVAAILEAVK